MKERTNHLLGRQKNRGYYFDRNDSFAGKHEQGNALFKKIWMMEFANCLCYYITGLIACAFEEKRMQRKVFIRRVWLDESGDICCDDLFPSCACRLLRTAH